MSGQRRERVSIAEVAALTEEGNHLPPTRNREVPPAGRRKPVEGYEVVALNFKCTPEMAQLISDLAEPVGGIRRLLARMLQDAGHKVPAYDLNPPSNRRWARRG